MPILMLPWIPVSLSAIISVAATLFPEVLTPATPIPAPTFCEQAVNNIRKTKRAIVFIIIYLSI